MAGLAFALGLCAGVARAEPPIWVARDADSEMVIFGSFHVLPPGLLWRPAALDAALSRADDLWFELPVDEATERETGRLAGALGVLPAAQSLSALLGPRDAARLARLAQAYGVDRMLLDRLEPWLAEVSLAAGVYRRAGAGAEHGVERAVSAAAPPAVRREAFETPAEQIDFFDKTPLADQLASLRATLDEIEADPKAYERLIAAWMAGDIKALERETAALRKASPVLFQRLVVQRNVRWTARLDTRLKGRGRTVVVVGAGHLVGEDGVPARLRALGYSVTGP